MTSGSLLNSTGETVSNLSVPQVTSPADKAACDQGKAQRATHSLLCLLFPVLTTKRDVPGDESRCPGTGDGSFLNTFCVSGRQESFSVSSRPLPLPLRGDVFTLGTDKKKRLRGLGRLRAAPEPTTRSCRGEIEIWASLLQGQDIHATLGDFHFFSRKQTSEWKKGALCGALGCFIRFDDIRISLW